MPLKIEITANDPHELRAIFSELGGALNLAQTTTPSVIHDHRGRAVATMEVHAPEAPADMTPEAGEDEVEEATTEEAPKRGRGRPPKNPPAAAAAPPTANNPAAVRDEATKLLIMVFSRVDKKGDAKVRELQKKYGVAKFADVPDDKVNDLLADAQKADEDTK